MSAILKNSISRGMSLVCIAILLFSCTTIPETGRQALILVPESQMLELGVQSYQEVLRENKLSQDQEKVDMVRRVGNRIAAAANRPDYNWEFNLIQDDEVANAFALPGGKVAVYTGILKYTQTEAGLATVMGHEVAHALARHGAERMTNIMLAEVGQSALSVALSTQSPAVAQAANTAFGVATNVGAILPFSRFQELEADRVGLKLMAEAGYDPEEAISFWQRMSQQQGSKPPEWLSTHPTDENRIAELQKELPEARKYYTPHNP